jgi:hypothetical protein
MRGRRAATDAKACNRATESAPPETPTISLAVGGNSACSWAVTNAASLFFSQIGFTPATFRKKLLEKNFTPETAENPQPLFQALFNFSKFPIFDFICRPGENRDPGGFFN